MVARAPSGLSVRAAVESDRDAIHALRHEVYAVELGQYPPNSAARLGDAEGVDTEYLVAESNGEIIGFIGVTPPSSQRFSLDKYLTRDQLPVSIDDRTYEVRALTLDRRHRNGPAALLLMRRAWDIVRKAGGERIVAMGRSTAVPMYRKVGMRSLGVGFTAGRVGYEVMSATVYEIDRRAQKWKDLSERVAPLSPPSASEEPPTVPAYHGGAFFGAIGEDFDDLTRRHDVISADVLDAWFPPSPNVVAALEQDLGWLLSTSPPTHGDGVVRAVAEARNLPLESIVLGAGSSALIFTAFLRWLKPESRVLIVDPSYSEYEHVLSAVIGCRVDRIRLDPTEGFRLDLDRLGESLQRGYDLAVIVNPNNPSGAHIGPGSLEPVLTSTPARTRIWVDEAYVEYAGRGQSLEALAADSDRIVVCKSLSKVLALSGARAAYLVAPPPIARELRSITPPWALSFPAQLAVVRALQDPGYYEGRYAETGALREALRQNLEGLAPWTVIAGVINAVLCLMPSSMPPASAVAAACRARGLYVRQWPAESTLGPRAIRVAVKDADTNTRILEILADVLRGARAL